MTDRSITILIVAAVILIIGTLLVRSYFMEEAGGPSPGAAEEETVKPRTAVRVKLTDCTRRYGRTESRGYIENVGNVDLHFVTVKSIWKNSSGLVIHTDTAYALKGEVLRPGERKKFEDVTQITTATKCNAEPIDWW